MPLSAPWPPPDPPGSAGGSSRARSGAVGAVGAVGEPSPFSVAAVLFDLDDTLLDAEAAWRCGVDRLVAERAVGVDPGLAVAAWGDVFPRWFDAYLLGELTLAESRAGRVRDWGLLVGAPVPPGAEPLWFDSYLAGYRAGWRLFPDVPDALAALAGLPIAIVTNGDSEQQREKVVGLGLDALVDVVVVSSEVGAAKPDPRMLLVAAERMGVPPADCLMVGDRLDRDVAAGLAAGMRAVWLRRPGGPDAATMPPPELVGRFTEIASLHELAALVVAGGIADGAATGGVVSRSADRSGVADDVDPGANADAVAVAVVSERTNSPRFADAVDPDASTDGVTVTVVSEGTNSAGVAHAVVIRGAG